VLANWVYYAVTTAVSTNSYATAASLPLMLD